MFFSCVLLIVGMFLLIKGADFFVDGSSKIAKFLKIPSLIIGLTLVSMGTSAPEASVSINAAVNNMNDLSIGNVVGSNIFNTLLILGVSSIFTFLCISKDMKKFDIPIMIFVYLVLLLFSFAISPLKIDLIESLILLVLFISYMVFLVLRAKKDKVQAEEKVEDINILKSLIYVIIGLTAIIFGGDLVVDSASEIAQKLGMSEALVGLTIVAVGTSLPELVTSIVASIKKENDIAIGNVVGSNIFNVIFILGASSTITSLTFDNIVLFDMAVMLVSAVLLFVFSLFNDKINRKEGIFFILIYVAYLSYIIIRN